MLEGDEGGKECSRQRLTAVWDAAISWFTKGLHSWKTFCDGKFNKLKRLGKICGGYFIVLPCTEHDILFIRVENAL